LGYKNVGIVDGTPVVHTRPVGRMRDQDLARRVLEESARLLAAHDCRQAHTTFGAFDARLRRIDTTPERLLADLVGGWQGLIDQDPRVLAWIADFQRPPEGWPAYPTEGTP
jgi:hypothetical protein